MDPEEYGGSSYDLLVSQRRCSDENSRLICKDHDHSLAHWDVLVGPAW